MNKVLLALSIMILSGSLLAQRVQSLQELSGYRSAGGQKSRWWVAI